MYNLISRFIIMTKIKLVCLLAEKPRKNQNIAYSRKILKKIAARTNPNGIFMLYFAFFRRRFELEKNYPIIFPKEGRPLIQSQNSALLAAELVIKLLSNSTRYNSFILKTKILFKILIKIKYRLCLFKLS